jgi:hypothetical protein
MNLLECLEEVKDFRRPQGQRYSHTALLLIIIMSILRNKNMYREIARFCEQNKAYLIKRFGFKNNRTPSHVTIRKFILSIDFASIQAAFHKWSQNYVSIEDGEWLAIDGKSIRSTVSDFPSEYQNFVSLVSVFCSKREQVLHSQKLENKHGNEISVVEDLLDILDLRGVVFTFDALHCQKKLYKKSPHKAIIM